MLAHPVAVAPDVDDVAVVQHTVDQRPCGETIMIVYGSAFDEGLSPPMRGNREGCRAA